MLIGAGLGVWGINGEFQKKCQFGGIFMVFTIVRRITGQIWVMGMGFQCEPGLCLSEIDLGAGWVGFSGSKMTLLRFSI